MAQREFSSRDDDSHVRIVAHSLQRTGNVTPGVSTARARIAAPTQKGRSEMPSRLRQVVLVDRDVDALRDIAVALRDQFDFHVTISGNEALALLQRGNIDAIVVGQTLYSSTGINVLAEARKRAPQVRRILMASVSEALDIDRVGVLAKPFSILERPCTPQKLLDLLDTDDVSHPEPSEAPPVESPKIKSPSTPPAPTSVAHSSPVYHGDYEHVILETPPELPRRSRRNTAQDAKADRLPIIVYTDNGDFYRAICTALQGEQDVRVATQLEQVTEMAEMGICPILITDRAGTQTELQRITIPLRASDPALVTIASGSPSEGLALRKLLNTPALHAFLPKPLSAPLVRLTVEAAKRHYLEQKKPTEQIIEPAIEGPAAPTRSIQSRAASYQPTQMFDRNFDIEERFDYRKLLPYAGVVALVLLLAAAGGWYWQQRGQEQARVSVLIDAELELAQKAYDAGDYVTPENANALYFYRRVLKRDPNQPQALKGIDNIVERLVERTERELTEDKLDAAAESVAVVRELRPDHKRLDFLEGQIRKANSYRQAQHLAEQSAQVARDEASRVSAANAQLLQERTSPATFANSTQRSQSVANWLATAKQRIAQGRLLTPDSDSAEYYLRLAERADPNNKSVEQGLHEIGTRLLAEAQDALGKQQLDFARKRLSDAARFGADAKAIARLQSDINSAADASVRSNYLRLALQRIRENALFEPAQDSARYYLSQLQRLDVNGTETQQALRAMSLKLIDNANQATAQQQYNTAIRLLDEARRLGFNGPELSDADKKLQLARNPPPAVQSPAPTQAPAPKVIKSAAAKFPEDAMNAGVSGWVDVAFKINAAGDVYDAVAIASNPPGPYATKFERAAINAISQYKFESRPINDAQIQTMVVRVQFKLH